MVVRVKPLFRWLLRRLRSQRFRRNLIVGLAIFLVVNTLILLIYRQRTFPNTKVAGQPLGSVALSALGEKLNANELLPSEVELKFNNQTARVSLESLGITLDAAQIHQSAQSDRSWLPIWNFIRKHNIPLYVAMDDSVFAEGLTKAIASFQQEAADAKLVLEKDEFKVIAEVIGQKLNTQTAKQEVLASIASRDFAIDLSAETTEPATKQDKLQTTLNVLKKQQSTEVTLNYNDKNKKLTPAEIASLYEQGDKTFDLSDNKIRNFITKIGSEFGIGVKNINDAVTAVKDSVFNNKATTFKLVASPKVVKHYDYCVAARGVDASNLEALSIKLASVYGDTRGWGLDGQVTFSKVNDSCDFTVWLAAADQMSSFGAICDAEWSCAVSPNVVINYKRWQEASAAWNGAGGNLDDYRTMVINHETGHYLSFGHANCGGAGQSAPVMQQQSIDLQGCKFNPWPTDSEKAQLKAIFGI